MLNRSVWLGLLGGSLSTALLGYTLTKNCLQEFDTPYPDSSVWIKPLALTSWLLSAIFFLRDRSNLMKNK